MSPVATVTDVSLDDVLRFFNLLGSGVVAGILLAFVVGFNPLLTRLPDASALNAKQLIDPLIDRISPPAIVVSMVTAFLILATAESLTATARIATVIGVLGSAGAAATSLGVNLPIHRKMGAWPVDAPPAEFRPTLRRWTMFHDVRTAFGVVAFASYLIAALSAIG